MFYVIAEVYSHATFHCANFLGLVLQEGCCFESGASFTILVIDGVLVLSAGGRQWRISITIDLHL